MLFSGLLQALICNFPFRPEEQIEYPKKAVPDMSGDTIVRVQGSLMVDKEIEFQVFE